MEDADEDGAESEMAAGDGRSGGGWRLLWSVCCRVAEFSAVIGAARARRDVSKRLMRRRGGKAGRAVLNELCYPQWDHHGTPPRSVCGIPQAVVVRDVHVC